MKLVILLGSPHRKGTTACLAEAFQRGALAAGHTVKTVFLPGEKIAPCLACNACKKTGACVQKDGAAAILRELDAADGFVFVSPVYYFGMSAQLKALIDRFYGAYPSLRGRGFPTALLTACADEEDWTTEPIVSHYRAICRYMDFTDRGIVAASGCESPEAEGLARYLAEAEALGRTF